MKRLGLSIVLAASLSSMAMAGGDIGPVEVTPTTPPPVVSTGWDGF